MRPRTRRARSACVAAARLTPGGVETAHPLPVLLRAPGPHSIRAVPPPPEPATRGFRRQRRERHQAARRCSRRRSPPRVLMAAAPSPGPAWSRAAAGDRGALRSRQTQRPASEPAGPTVAADDAPTSCLGDNGTASLPWALSTATCSAQVRRPASRPSCPLFPASSQPQRPTPRCRQICAGTTSSCSNFPDGSVHFRPFPLEKISPAPGNRIRQKNSGSNTTPSFNEAAGNTRGKRKVLGVLVEQHQVASMRPRGIPAENARTLSCRVVRSWASMRPRGIPAENIIQTTSGSVPNLRFNEAAGNTRGKHTGGKRCWRRPSVCFNEAAGNTRGKRRLRSPGGHAVPASMRPRGIPAENPRVVDERGPGQSRFNEAAGNTRGKPPPSPCPGCRLPALQ